MGDSNAPLPNRTVLGVSPGDIPSAWLKTGAFASGASAIGVDFMLPYLVLFNTDSAAHTIKLAPRATVDLGNAVVQFSLAGGASIAVPTTPFALCTDAGANGDVFWFYSDVGLPSVAGGTGLAANSYQSEPAAKSLTTTSEMFGFGTGAAGTKWAFTPNKTGACFVVVCGFMSFAAAGVVSFAVNCPPYYGTGAAPSNGAATTGTVWPAPGFDLQSSLTITVADETSMLVPFYYGGLFNGVNILTVGTTYWFDFGLFSLTGASTFSITGSISVTEYPP